MKTKCKKCQGVGVTRWQAFVHGLAWLIGGLVVKSADEIPKPYCNRCDGGGWV